MSATKPMASVSEHPAKAAAPKRHAEQLHSELWSAAISLQGAGDIMDQLQGLFVAIRKLGGQETLQLARVGEGLAADWSDLLGSNAERALALCEEHKAAPPTAKPSSAPALTPAVAAVPGSGLSMAAYDTATLHLGKAETLAEMLCALGSGGLDELTPAGIVGAFAALQGELFEVRAALEQGRTRGDA